MKENIFDVLMYLFENYMEGEAQLPPDVDAIHSELVDAGFKSDQVNKAFNWIDALSLENNITEPTSSTFRVFSPKEIDKLDIDCRNLILFLEQDDILNAYNREIVIDRVMALDEENISMEKLKWIILMVLLSQPDEEIAFSRMEDIVYDLMPTYLN